MLTHGSLFAGIGGFDLGFERAGIKTLWQVEINAYCRQVLARHFPLARRFADIRECFGPHAVFADTRKSYLPQVDILSGGFPCQDISNAGKRAGIDGERSGLWAEYARLICELRPRIVVVENVAALLHRGIERVLGDLAACGYDAEWQSIRASDVGAPHRRDRIWIVAYPARDLRRAPGHAGSAPSDGCGADVADAEGIPERAGFRARESHRVRYGRSSDGSSPPILPHADCERCEEQPVFTQWRSAAANQERPNFIPFTDAARWWAVEPDVGRVAHGIPARVDLLRGLGNAIVPQIAEIIGRQIVAFLS